MEQKVKTGKIVKTNSFPDIPERPPKGAWLITVIIIAFIAVLFAVLYIISAAGQKTDRNDSYAESKATAGGMYMVDEAFYEGEELSYAVAEEETMAAADAMLPAPVTNAQMNGAKIIQTASVSLQTKEFDKATKGIESLVAQFGGYLEYQNVNNKVNSGYRNAYYTARIPAENLDAFLNNTANISTVSSLTRNAQDISSSYYDTSSRLATAKIKLERLQELMKNAKKMEDIITLENEISEIEWEIDNLSGTLNQYDSKINYSTVDIVIEEVYAVTADEKPVQTFGDKIAQAFKESIDGIRAFAEGFVVFVVEAWFVLLIIAVVIVVVIVLVKRHINKKKNNS